MIPPERRASMPGRTAWARSTRGHRVDHHLGVLVAWVPAGQVAVGSEADVCSQAHGPRCPRRAPRRG
jgi:hypothetical protein